MFVMRMAMVRCCARDVETGAAGAADGGDEDEDECDSDVDDGVSAKSGDDDDDGGDDHDDEALHCGRMMIAPETQAFSPVSRALSQNALSADASACLAEPSV